MTKILLAVFLILTFADSQASTHEHSLFINGGIFTTVDSSTFPYLAFNSSSSFNQTNANVLVSEGDSLLLKIINTDTALHSIVIKGLMPNSIDITNGDSTTLRLFLTSAKTYHLHDVTDAHNFRYLGLSTMIIAKPASPNIAHFYWNIKDHQANLNSPASKGETIDWSTYYPDYFTINGVSNPNIDLDTNAKVVGNVGDTLYIHILNSGNAYHSLHFHGYHYTVIQADNTNRIGRSKDTAPIKSEEIIVLQIVPHQKGEYPVHDHNLVAVSAGGIYPNGMFTTIVID